MKLEVKVSEMVNLLRDGQPVKMSKRAGTFETLRDVVDEVGRDPVRFMMIYRSPEMKLDFDFTIAPKTLDEAMMYRALILGEGEYFDTLTSRTGIHYGSKGYSLTGTGTYLGASGGNPINTNGCFRATTGQTMQLQGWFYDQSAVSTANAGLFGATAIGWRRDDGTGNYRAFGWSWRSKDTTATVKREALGTTGPGTLGAAGAYTGAETFAVTSRNLVVTAAASTSYSNIHILPWYLKAPQIDALIAGRNLVLQTHPQLPMLYVQTDFLSPDNVKASGEDSVLICHGEVDKMVVQPAMNAGAFEKTFSGMTAKLIEV